MKLVCGCNYMGFLKREAHITFEGGRYIDIRKNPSKNILCDLESDDGTKIIIQNLKNKKYSISSNGDKLTFVRESEFYPNGSFFNSDNEVVGEFKEVEYLSLYKGCLFGCGVENRYYQGGFFRNPYMEFISDSDEIPWVYFLVLTAFYMSSRFQRD